MSNNRYGGVDSYAAFFIAIKAKTMIRTGLFSPDDREDIEQELMMAYLKDESNFNGNRAEKETFIRMVINHRSIQMIREITTDKRKVRLKELSLDQPTFDDDETLFIDQLDDTRALWGDKPFESFADLSIQRIDILKIRESLPADLQQIFDLMMEHTISEAAAILKIPRTTFSSRVKKLKEHLMQSQFKNYF
ncbi:MAG: sigma-70 family RNA polymerase sigma factor [Alphaproteobacteria bacterium]|jgi:RNA polymerase sigma factor (sigma-70 family)|nr:sigma-70 family RNA polymerase sigma factor [Alphaproteobacteria bacterium]